MTAVKLRHEYDIEPQHLADVPFADLDTVIPTLKKWGLNEESSLCAQFVYSETGAYFEVIICEPEDDT